MKMKASPSSSDVAADTYTTAGIGAEASIDGVDLTGDRHVNEAAALFGESASRIVISLAEDAVTRVLERAAAAAVPARVIGRTGGNRLRIAVNGRLAIDVSIDEAERRWSAAIESHFERKIA